MVLTVLQEESQPKATPRFPDGCGSTENGSWHTAVPLHKYLRVVLHYRIKSHFGREYLPLASCVMGIRGRVYTKHKVVL
ncbi:MAG: hypothetical protein JO232_01965 [Verrucomicrobia bacterium]|nr:hypothetical protein [Verrucomicrobiota bacterium]